MKPWLIAGSLSQQQEEALKDVKLRIATPCYDESVRLGYHHSVQLFSMWASQYVELTFDYTGKESLIQRARNTLAARFLDTDATHFLFIDADVNFQPHQPLELVLADKDVIGGAYPKKEIDWDRVAAAAKAGVEAKYLPFCSGRFTCNWVTNAEKKLSLFEPFLADYMATGFLCIKRAVLEKFIETYPDRWYRLLPVPGAKIHEFFAVEIDNHVLLSEDYWFCAEAKKLGFSVYLAPWMHLGHTGSYTYNGQLFASNGSYPKSWIKND